MEDFVVDPAMAARMQEGLAELSGPSAEEEVAAARQVGDALRSLIERFTGTGAPPDVLRQAAARLSEMEDLLRPYRNVRRYSGSSEASGVAHDRAFFDWSPFIGHSNPLAPPMRVQVEGSAIVGYARFGIAYEGPPGCVHGGFIAGTFDELLGLTQSLAGRAGMTGTLTVKYRRPTPLFTDLRIVGRVTSVQGRKVLTNGQMFAGEALTTEATGLFVSIPPEMFTALSAQRERA